MKRFELFTLNNKQPSIIKTKIKAKGKNKMIKIVNRLLAGIGYNDNFSVMGYMSFYETLMGVVINNFTRNKDFYLSNDENFSWSFLPNGYLLLAQWDVLNTFALNNEDIFGKDPMITSALINEYEERNKEAGIKNLLLEWLHETKEFNEYLLQNNLTSDINNISSHLISYYVEKSKMQTWILDISVLIVGCLASPNFYNLEATFNKLNDQNASNINPLYEIFNKDEM